MKPHKHAEVIKAWADGAAIEVRGEFTDYQWWTFQADYVPSWSAKNEYRIKPEPKPDEIRYFKITAGANLIYAIKETANIKIIWDGETGKLKDAEVLE